MKRPDPQQIELPILATLVSTGPGQYTLRPRLPDTAGETWISSRQAKTISGQSFSTLYRLGEVGVLKSRRPTPTKWEFELGRLQEYLTQIRDPEYWHQNPQAAAALVAARRGTPPEQE